VRAWFAFDDKAGRATTVFGMFQLVPNQIEFQEEEKQ
jgi:hypothetical protein